MPCLYELRDINNNKLKNSLGLTALFVGGLTGLSLLSTSTRKRSGVVYVNNRSTYSPPKDSSNIDLPIGCHHVPVKF